MTADVFSLLSHIAYAAAGLAAALAIFLFFMFKIPEVIGDLSGRTARKNAAKIRSANERGGNKAFTPGRVNEERGKLTNSMRLEYTPADTTVDLKSSQNDEPNGRKDSEPTDLLNEQVGFPKQETDVLPTADETISLAGVGGETTPLNESARDISTPDETTPLSDTQSIETTKLTESADDETKALTDQGKAALEAKGWVLLESVVFIHTEEVIC